MTGVYLRRFVRGLGLAAVALLLLHTNPYAQTCDDWEWVRPSPQGNPLYGACYANGWFYGVGARGAIVRSPDGLTWEHIPAPDAERLNDIAWCGTYYAAVGWDGVILRSTDGAAWEAVHSEPYWCLNTIASNGSLAVAASSGRLLTSSDGYSWTESSYEYGFYDLIWTGVQFVGAGSYGRFHTSTDGLSWTLHTIEGATTFDAVAWSGTTYVFVENDGVVWVSDDLETWESHTLDTTDYLQINDVIWTGGSFYAVSDRRFSPQAGGDPYWAILSSGDGVAWTPHLIPDEMPLRALAAGEGRIVAVGYERADSRNVCAILSSEDGEVWTNHVEYEDFSFERLLWTGAEYRALGYRATGNYDDRGRYVASSPDGETWSFLPLPDEWWQPNGLIWDGSQYVIVGWNSYDGRSLIATSPDGVDWTERHGGIQNMIFRDVSWNGDSYVCVGEFLGSASSGGVIYHSPDGLDWREATADNTYPVRSVDWGGAHYVALGGEVSYKGWSQIIQTSKHGAEWTVQYENIYPDEKGYSELTDAAWNGSLYVAVGRAGEVRISPNGHTWTEPEEDLQVELCSVIWAGDRFLGVGESGSILTTEDGVSWTDESLHTDQHLYEVVWTGPSILAVGEWGTILRRSCSQAPLSVSVHADPLGGPAPHEVFLSAEVRGGTPPYACTWEFGDGQTWPDQSAFHTYQTEGIYHPAVTVQDGAGDTLVDDTLEIEVTPMICRLSCTAAPDIDHGMAPLPVSFTAEATLEYCIDEAAFLWDFGDGHTSSDPLVNHTYEEEGIYEWTLSVTADDAVCTHEGTVSVIRPCVEFERTDPLYLDEFRYAIAQGNVRTVAVGREGVIMVENYDGRWAFAETSEEWNLYSVIWDGTRFLAGGTLGWDPIVLSSPDGLEWTVEFQGVNQRSSLQIIRNISQGDQGFVAAGDGIVLFSPDGANWIEIGGEVGDRFQNDVAWGAGYFVLVSDVYPEEPHRGYRSADGLTWEPIAIPINEWNLFDHVCWGGSRFVAVGDDGSIAASEDGLTWTQVKEPEYEERATDITWNGEFFLMSIFHEEFLKSADGVEWTRFDPPGLNDDLQFLEWQEDRFLGLGGSQVYSSPDGMTWTRHTYWEYRDIWDLAYGDGRYVAVGEWGLILVSSDGWFWDHFALDEGRLSLKCIEYGDGRFVAGGEGLYSSADGETWSMVDAADIEDCVWAGDRFVCLGDEAILRSMDGEDWTTLSTPGITLDCLAWNGTRFVALSGTQIATSPDGQDWTFTPATEWETSFRDLIWDGSRFVALNPNGQEVLFFSSDGLTWELIDAEIGGYGSLLWDGGQYWLTGGSGYVSTSRDLVRWERLDTPPPSRYMRSGLYDGERILFAGEEGVVFIHHCPDNPCTPVCQADMPDQGAVDVPVPFSAQVTLEDCSEHAFYYWDFGDGSSSFDPEPTHAYAQQGSYAWTLSVRTAGVTCTDEGTLVIGAADPGDCNGDGAVSLGEVQRAVNMFLGVEVPDCGVDTDGNGAVSIGEVQRVINGFLG